MNILDNVTFYNRYRIRELIDSDESIFTKHHGIDVKNGEDIEIKILNPARYTRFEVDKICFERDLAIIREFDHPNILRVFAADTYANSICVISEFFKSENLDEYLQKHGPTVDLRTALSITSQLASALSYAHRHKITHKSIKSLNIFIAERKGELIVKLADFGMSYIIDYANQPNPNIEADYGYMSPEATGLLDRKPDERSDIYSLGIVLYRLLTGVLPFHASTVDNMVYQHVAGVPTPPNIINPSIPAEISGLIMKLLAKDPDLRYQSASELSTDIDRFINEADKLGNDLSDEDLVQTIDAKVRLLCRKDELNALRDSCSFAIDKCGCICLVSGSIGSGKSDLFNNFCSELSHSDIVYFRAHFSQQNMLTPYSAFHDILDQYYKLFNGFDRKIQVTEKTRLSRLLNGLSDIVASICPSMKKILPASLALPSLDGFKEHKRSEKLLTDFFLSLGPQEKSFIIILDDLEYADAASISLLTEMAKNVTSHKVFLVCSYRPDDTSSNLHLQDFLSKVPALSGYAALELAPYTESRMCEFLSDLLGINRADCEALASYMMEKTEGNPYFTANFLRSMLEDGVISVFGRTLETDWNRLKYITTNDDMRKIVQTRVNMLPDEAVAMLEVASVIGVEFRLSLLIHVMGLSHEVTAPWIDQALSLHFIDYNSASDNLTFSHDEIHRFFLERLDENQRKVLHSRIAASIEATSDPEHCDVYALIYHLTEADDTKALRKHIMTAALRARESNAVEESINYFNRALDLLSDEGRAHNWFTAKRALVELNLTAGHFDEAISAANELLPVMEDNADKATLMYYIGLGYFRQSKFDSCEETLLEALSLLGESVPRSRFNFRSRYRFLSMRRFFASKFISDPTQRKLEETQKYAAIIVPIYNTLAQIFAYTNEDKFNYTVLRLYSYTYLKVGVSNDFAYASSNLALYYMARGRKRLCEAQKLLAFKLHKDFNDSYGHARALLYAGICSQWGGEIERSIRYFEDALTGLTEAGDIWEINNANAYLAYSLQIAGKYTEAIALCGKVIENSSVLDDPLTGCIACATLAACYIESTDYAAAETILEKAEELVGNVHIPFASVFTALVKGRLLIVQNKFAEAEDILQKGIELYDDSGYMREYTASIFGYYAIAYIRQLDKERQTLGLDEVQRRESHALRLCKKAKAYAGGRDTQILPACRAEALYGAITERHKLAEVNYISATEIVTNSEYRYEGGRLYYDFGQYLLTQHRQTEARYYIFEAYMTFSGISSNYYIKKCETIIAEKYHNDFTDNSLLADVTARRNRMNIDRKVNTLLRLGERMTSTLELDDLQKKILQDAVELVGAERGILFLYPETGEKKLYVASVFNLGNFDCNTYDWMLAEVEKTRKPIVINDVQSDEYRKNYTVMVRYGIKSVMAMPMFVRGDLYGIIYLDSRLVRQIFSDEYVETMGFIANQAGAPIANARLYHRAITDGLTGIFGRSYLDNLVVDLTDKPDARLAAIMVDVDNFKHCNDTYGHAFGDEVLKKVAGTMKRISSGRGISCRYGGEEFVIILENSDTNEVLALAEKIRSAVENTSIPFNDGNEVKMVNVTISLGVSIWDTSMSRVDLVEHADKAMYYAKQHGKNQVTCWTPLL